MPVVPEKWVLGLHERRGRYITLSNDKRRAIREGDTYDHGMVFSDRPLHIGEVFQLKIEDIESKWAGSLVSKGYIKFRSCYCKPVELIQRYHVHSFHVMTSVVSNFTAL